MTPQPPHPSSNEANTHLGEGCAEVKPIDPPPMRVSEQDVHVGVGLMARLTVPNSHMGHMWVFWPRDHEGGAWAYGYYPDVSEVPEEYLSNQGLQEYFQMYSVRGFVKSDERWHGLIPSLVKRDRAREKRWAVSPECLWRLRSDCEPAVGEHLIQRGSYSWNESLQNTHNCCSWAVDTLNQCAGQSLVHCDFPKRLTAVHDAIWGAGVSP